jgi:hypothetical protein
VKLKSEDICQVARFILYKDKLKIENDKNNLNVTLPIDKKIELYQVGKQKFTIARNGEKYTFKSSSKSHELYEKIKLIIDLLV